MPALSYTDHRRDPAAWALRLGLSREAIDLYLGSDVIDLHIDSFIWTRMFGYDLTRRHGRGLFGGCFYSQVDLPRIREAQIAGGIWSITTNPARSLKTRPEIFSRNLDRLRAILAKCQDDVELVRNEAEYRAARAEHKHAVFLGIQGGNALDENEAAFDRLLDDAILQVTLVHLSRSSLGMTSTPLLRGRDDGLTTRGKDYVRGLNARRIFVDLAHLNRRGFFDAVAIHDRSQPLIVTHTGIAGVHRHWRNLDDEQLRAIAERGGTIGVIYQSGYLGDPYFGGRAATIVDHLAYIVEVVGEDFASLGSDWDGAIVTPRDLPTCLELPRLVQIMLDRGWSETRIQKILGGNFLRTLKHLRG